ncbi:hypothetical protein B5M44_21995 [Shinella sumterensis]|uniref:hypothetical protein n=1 Tax=Shinella sumterensis TaxID=1967501 RepID=UPI00106EB762|nr:hypothetical protein [Shinella sumterensis]MCD1266908.1 hypothetical protein [Shinella sumterensis]TFE95210.1 hypothetical protein B5M44_21995 [Shinella sumterensis]
MNRYSAEQYLCISASESGTEVELQMVVDFTVHPGSKATMIDPPEGPLAEVEDVKFFLMREGKPSQTPAALPVWMINLFCDNDDFQQWMLSEAADQHVAAVEDAADATREMMLEDREA